MKPEARDRLIENIGSDILPINCASRPRQQTHCVRSCRQLFLLALPAFSFPFVSRHEWGSSSETIKTSFHSSIHYRVEQGGKRDDRSEQELKSCRRRKSFLFLIESSFFAFTSLLFAIMDSCGRHATKNVAAFKEESGAGVGWRRSLPAIKAAKGKKSQFSLNLDKQARKMANGEGGRRRRRLVWDDGSKRKKVFSFSTKPSVDGEQDEGEGERRWSESKVSRGANQRGWESWKWRIEKI